MKRSILVLVFFCCVPPLAAQPLASSKAGPIVLEYGAVYPIEQPDMPTPVGMKYRMLFDVKTSPDAADALNASLNTVARFLNMHAQAGVPHDDMEVAIVLHGSAGKYALDHAAYEERFGVSNTNLSLMETLHAAGVQIYLCGQTAIHRGLARESLSPVIEVALSAMTAISKLDQEGYTMIAF